MAKCRIILDSFKLINNNLFHIFFDLVVVGLYHFLHVVNSVFIHKVGDNGDFLITLFFFGYLCRIHHYFTMENLLLDTLGEVIGNGADKHTLRQSADFARRYHAIHLGGYGGGLVIAVDAYTLTFLQYFAETLGQGFSGFSDNLAGEYIAHGVDDYFGFLVGIVTDELGEVLKAQEHGNFVATGGGDEVVQPFDKDGGQLVDDDGTL